MNKKNIPKPMVTLKHESSTTFIYALSEYDVIPENYFNCDHSYFVGSGILLIHKHKNGTMDNKQYKFNDRKIWEYIEKLMRIGHKEINNMSWDEISLLEAEISDEYGS